MDTEGKREVAREVVEFNGQFVNGGLKCSHSGSKYGQVLKYMIFEKGWTYRDAGEMLGVTPQAVNNIVNRMGESSFNVIYVRRLCVRLGIDEKYFRELSNLVGEILDERKGK